MKNLFAMILMLGLCGQSYAADQWTKTLSGSSQAADIDALITTSWTAQDRLGGNYRAGCAVVESSVATITVLGGELAIPNSDSSVVRYRENTSSTSVSWSDIDTGAEANSTQYYVYALADSDATTFTVKISTSSSAPSGATYYRKIGYFYNNSSGNITSVGNYTDSGMTSRESISSSSDISVSSSSYADLTDIEVRHVSSGNPITMMFTGSIDPPSQGTLECTFDVDGTDYGATWYGPDNHNEHTAGDRPFNMHWTIGAPSAGTKTVKVQCKTSNSAYTFKGTTNPTILTVTEN